MVVKNPEKRQKSYCRGGGRKNSVRTGAKKGSREGSGGRASDLCFKKKEEETTNEGGGKKRLVGKERSQYRNKNEKRKKLG